MNDCEYPRCKSDGRSYVQAYAITYPDGTIRVHLCRKHAKALDALRHAIKKEPRPPIKRGAGTTPIPDEWL